MSTLTPQTKSKLFLSRIVDRRSLTKAGSSKETYHIALDLTGSEISYTVGDSIAVYAENREEMVARYLKGLALSGDEQVLRPKSEERITLREFLTKHANLSRLTSNFFKVACNHLIDASLKADWLALLETAPALNEFLKAHEPLDLLESYSFNPFSAEELAPCFASMLPRFYSIASSQSCHPNEVHLTVTISSYMYKNELRYGVATHHLCHLAKPDSTLLPIYLQPHHGFTLPADKATPILMIGPGTGVAPFRAFMQERKNGPGKSWLFFGERNSATDFYYEQEWKELVLAGKLRLSTAFSRDQEEKIYVQHLLAQNSSDVWAWIQEGAVIYVCGDAEKMAKDVDSTLIAIAQKEGNLAPDDAKAFFKNLRKTKRYLLDVY